MQKHPRAYVVEEVELDFGRNGTHAIRLVGPNAARDETHFTLLAGANGTSKSRILAKLVEQLTQIWASQSATRLRLFSAGAHGLACQSLTVSSDTLSYRYSSEDDQSGTDPVKVLPSRILALSNLVMDKFHFVREERGDEPFYYYLGVRQASNLTTTGSTERSVSDAILKMMGKPERLADFDAWVDLVFGMPANIGLAFPRVRVRSFEGLLLAKDRMDFVRRQKNRQPDELEVEKVTGGLVEVAEFLVPLINDRALKAPTSAVKRVDILLANALKPAERKRLAEIAVHFPAASRMGMSIWPTPYFETQELLPWGHLSSGEQNLLSVGAKLVAHAAPGSLIVIDEPEVSLNVIWQQQYMHLVERSLRHVHGCHVLIATHSPHLIASLPRRTASVVLAKRENQGLSFSTKDAAFEGWGSESVLYRVLDIPSTSSFDLNREIAAVLRHIQEGGKDKLLIESFLKTMSRLNYDGMKPLELVVAEVERYLETLE